MTLDPNHSSLKVAGSAKPFGGVREGIAEASRVPA
jgi:hypothetical protein